MSVVLALCFVLYKYPFTKAVTVGGIDNREMMSVPAQQIARVYSYHFDELDGDTKNEITRLFSDYDIRDYYQPMIADATKGAIDYTYFEENKIECIKLYFQLFSEYPWEYINSVLENTYGFWYLLPKLCVYTDGTSKYLVVDSYDPIVMDSKLPKLLSFYRLFDYSKLVDGSLVISFVFMPAFYLYFTLYSLFFGVKNKKNDLVIINLFAMVLWATFLLGPVVLVRYIFYMMLMFPMNIVLIYLSRTKNE